MEDDYLISDLFEPRLDNMDSDYPRGGGASASDGDFGFAFNDSNFSDRLLRIEIIGDPPECRADGDCARHQREDIIRKENGDEGANVNDSSWNTDCSTVVRVNTLHISSPILAAKSPFSYKLFLNGMRKSEQRHVTVRINESEEVALMELLNFIYRNTLSVTNAPALLDVLMAADKFEVSSCMRYCSRLLQNEPMTPEFALLYLDLPSTVLMAEAVQPLTDAARQYLAARFKDTSKFQEEVMDVPLAGIEAILSSDDLQVPTRFWEIVSHDILNISQYFHNIS